MSKVEDVIDLRSDTVSSPCEKMREVMRNAEVGDELYGDDPSTKLLEGFCAGFFAVRYHGQPNCCAYSY